MNVIRLIHNGFKMPTEEADALKRELKKRGVTVYVELNDGYKRIDLALPKSKINIEVDGIRHLTDSHQIVADLARGYFSYKRGYSTMHIPNEMIHLHLTEIADALAEASKIREQKISVHLTK